MANLNQSKLNYLLNFQPQAIVLTATWLRTQGYSRFLINHYCTKKWLVRVGEGAYVRAFAPVKWPGAIYALQKQLKLPVNVAGITALELQGLAHNIVMNDKNTAITIFNSSKEKYALPK